MSLRSPLSAHLSRSSDRGTTPARGLHGPNQGLGPTSDPPSGGSPGHQPSANIAAVNPITAFLRPWWQARTYSAALYLFVALPLGVVYFTFVVTFVSVGLGTLFIGVGALILIIGIVCCRALGAVDRAMATAMLGAEIDDPPPVLPTGDGFMDRSKELFVDSFTWRSVLWLLLRFPLGLSSFVVVVVLSSVGLSLLAVPIASRFADVQVDGERLGDIDVGDGQTLEQLVDSPSETIPAFLLGVFVILITPHVIRGLGWFHRIAANGLLGPSARVRAAELEERTTELEERQRLARELHDSVGHTITATTLQAGAARHVFDDNPEFARQALTDIEDGGRRALDELDRVLGLLRADEEGNKAPAPGLADLDTLVADTRRAGLPVDLHTIGAIDSIPDPVGRSVYRIVQESLTNVMKHAGRVGATVTLAVDAAEATVTIENAAPVTPPPASPPSAGRGLVGLRERAGAYGGSVLAAPTPQGGFKVQAILPIEGG